SAIRALEPSQTVPPHLRSLVANIPLIGVNQVAELSITGSGSLCPQWEEARSEVLHSSARCAWVWRTAADSSSGFWRLGAHIPCPAYQNLRQKVDNFVSTHLDKQEWNPTMNKNQLRNGLRQSVVQSGMLEAGVDRIICQVVDPKLNHIFRPQIERAIHEFLAAQKKEAVPAPPPEPESQDPPAPSQDAS
uniref:BOD1/SHG1 domain-containing protein n=1 Tax=Equus caballus TaxID=9796 RepID=A0A9L0S933_HORSE